MWDGNENKDRFQRLVAKGMTLKVQSCRQSVDSASLELAVATGGGFSYLAEYY